MEPRRKSRSNSEDEDLVDPMCTPKNIHKITFDDINAAASHIKGQLAVTPCSESKLSDATGMSIFLKKDFLQYTGSFKERGACNALMKLTEDQKKRGVISASLGNHALGMCYHGQRLRIPVTVVMPTAAPIMKIQSCKRYGANVIVQGDNMKEAKNYAMKLGKEKGWLYINGYDHPDIIAGQGTLGMEICEQVKNIDAIVVPVGGGGLIAGVALAAKSLNPKIKIIGVESDKCPGFSHAMARKGPSEVPIHATLADGLAVPLVGFNAYAIAAPLIDKMVVIKEEWIAIAILRIIEVEKCVVEGAGASGLGAVLAGQLDEFKGKKVVLTLSGANIDTTILGRCLERGLAADGRLMKFSVTISDQPGGMAELGKLISDTGVSIKDVSLERGWLSSDVFSVKVTVVAETMDKEQANRLKNVIKDNYHTVSFVDMVR